MNLVSDTTFRIFLTALTGGVGGTWMFLDAFKIWKLRNAPPGDAVAHDKRFGYGLGVVIGVVAILGCLMFWNVI